MNWVESRILVEKAYLDGYEDARKDFISCIESLHKDEVVTAEVKHEQDEIKVGDEVIAKLPSRRDHFKAVILKEDKKDPVYQFCVIDKEGYTFWISKEDIFKTGKAFPISDMLAQLDRDSGMEGKE